MYAFLHALEHPRYRMYAFLRALEHLRKIVYAFLHAIEHPPAPARLDLGWFDIVKTMLFEKQLICCLYLQWYMNMPFIFACIYNGFWTRVSYSLVFTMVLERVCQLLLVFTMNLKHEIKEINILLVFTMVWQLFNVFGATPILRFILFLR